MPRYDIVVSAENNAYMVWQAMLFHASCVRHMDQTPIIVVHTDSPEVLPGFERIRKTGGRVQTAPDYRRFGGVNYPPRNTAASLKHVQSDADFIVLCDPDMVFLRPLPLKELNLADRQVSFDFVGYLNGDLDEHQPALDEVCHRAGIDPMKMSNPQTNGGVPHVIPSCHSQSLSNLWLDLIEMFPSIPPCSPEDTGARPRECHIGPQKGWLTTMWALVMAAERLKLQPVLTRWCISNSKGGRPLPIGDSSGPCMIHYCYRDEGFHKHEYDTREAAERDVWNQPPDDGSVCGNVRAQLRQACEFFGLS